MRFLASTDCYFGDERYQQLAAAHVELCATGGIMLVDGALETSVALEALLERLAEVGILPQSVQFVAVDHEPTYNDLDSMAEHLRSLDPRFIVAVGGGSLLDLAKGSSVLLENSGTGRDYRGMGLVKNPMRSLLAVPTTAGTGSEVTWTASFVDDETHIKLGINGPNVFPTAALLEPDLLAGSPREVALSAGLDSLVHAVEAVSSPMASPVSTTLAVAAVKLVMGSLPAALAEQSAQAWQPVQLGAYLAGLAMLNSQGGVASGVSYPIGTRFGVPHGFAGGILLPWVTAFNTDHGYTGYEVFSAAIGSERAFSADLHEMFRALDVPRTLTRWGAGTPQAAAELLDLTLTQRRASLDYNPVPFSEVDLEELLGHVCQTD